METNELEVIQHPQINGLSIFFDTVDYRTPHLHPEFEIILVLENSLVVTCEQKQFTVVPGSFLIFNPNQLHEFHKENEECTFLCLQISPKCFSFSTPLLDELLFNEFSPDQGLNEEQVIELRTIFFNIANSYFYKKEGYELYCTGEAALFMYRLLEIVKYHRITREEKAEQFRKNARLQRLMAFVDENYTHKIRLSDFAEQENRSLSYLSHFIKDNLKQSFQDYVTNVRFNAARKLMTDSNLRLLDICMETGFSDYRYFSEAFKERTSMTPEDFRKTLTEQKEAVKIHRSIHSHEKFYTRKTSFELLDKYKSIFL